MESNSLAYIGLAQRAGKTLAGSAAAEKGLHRGSIALLLLQDTLSESSKRHFGLLCERYHVAYRILHGSVRIGPAVGRDCIQVLGITDHGFAGTIRNIIDGVQGSGSE